jgi:hypothetical protein
VRNARFWVLLVGLVLVLAACGRVSPTSTATETPSPAPSQSPTAAPTPLTIPGPTFHMGEVELAYAPVAYQVTGGNMPYVWMISDGALPGGLSISANGVISGMPTVAGTFKFTAEVTDASLATANVAGAISIAPRLTFQYIRHDGYAVDTGFPFVNVCIDARAEHPCPSPDPRNSPFASASGGVQPYTYAVASGSLPPGTALNGLALRGTFTGYGLYVFSVRVTDSLGASVVIGIEFWLYRT